MQTTPEIGIPQSRTRAYDYGKFGRYTQAIGRMMPICVVIAMKNIYTVFTLTLNKRATYNAINATDQKENAMDGINMLVDELIDECRQNELMRDESKQKLIDKYASIRALYNAGCVTKREAAGMIASYYAG